MTRPRALLLGGSSAAKSLTLDSPELVELLLGAETGSRLSPAAAYRTLGWARRAVQLRAGALASIPWGVYKLGQDPADADPLLSSESATAPEALTFIAGLGRLLALWEASLALEGAAFSLKLLERGRRVGLQYWSPHAVRLDYDAAGGELGNGIARIHHRIQAGPNQAQHEISYAPSEVLHIFQPDPYAEAGPGSPDGQSARTGADVLEGLGRFVDSYLDRGLVRATILSVPSSTPAPERSRFEEWWNRYFSGQSNAGRQKVLNADAVTVTPIGEGIDDLSAPELVESMREEVAAGLGVPYQLLTSNAANYATAQVELARLYLHTAIPQAERVIAPALNEQLLYEAGLMLVFHPERVEALQAMELERAEAVQKAVGRPVLTVNEGRAILGKQRLDGEEFDTIAPQQQPAFSFQAGGAQKALPEHPPFW